MSKVAILDDDEEFAELLKTLIASRRHHVTVYASAGKLLDGVMKDKPDLLVLDVNLPGMSGLELVRILRRSPELKRSAIVVVSGSETRPGAVVKGLDDGADEYFSKPVDAELFLARIDGLLRRYAEAPQEERHEILELGTLRLDITERTVSIDKKPPLPFTRLEFDLVEFFLRNPDRVITRSVLLQEVWRDPPDIETRTVDKHVQNVRRKLGRYGEGLETLYRIGYVFRPKTAKSERGA